MKGFSIRNIKYMRAFAEAYPQFVQALPAQLQSNENQIDIIMQGAPAQLTWYHHTTILDKVKDNNLRNFYIKKTIENGWSRNIMLHQIESQLHLRQGNAITNFELTLCPPPIPNAV